MSDDQTEDECRKSLDWIEWEANNKANTIIARDKQELWEIVLRLIADYE